MTTSMTKAQTIRKLVQLGFTDPYSRPRSSTVEITSPDGQRIIADAKDLLAEVEAGERAN